MRLLPDTQAVLWFVTAGSRLSPAARSALESDRATILISAVVVLEVAIKTSIGKLQRGAELPTLLGDFEHVDLPVTAEHAWRLRTMPLHHRDPFDRLLVAQAQAEEATLVTADAALGAYDIPILW